MDSGYYKILVLTVTAILVISLAINALMISDSGSFSSPPVRISGYITARGEPAPGYFTPSGQNPLDYLNQQNEPACK